MSRFRARIAFFFWTEGIVSKEANWDLGHPEQVERLDHCMPDPPFYFIARKKCFSLEKGKWVRIDEQNKKILGSGQFLKV